eukprot:143105-Chlamydomonas_euryale.AAC.2
MAEAPGVRLPSLPCATLHGQCGRTSRGASSFPSLRDTAWPMWPKLPGCLFLPFPARHCMALTDTERH